MKSNLTNKLVLTGIMVCLMIFLGVNSLFAASAVLSWDPSTTKANGTWNDTSGTTPWLYGDSVWSAPNSIGVDGSATVDWNIVQTSHNLTSGNQDITVLALISDR